jgi:hypothetical protein
MKHVFTRLFCLWRNSLKSYRAEYLCITFDQPLFIKAVDIVRASGLKVVVRLGGFHTLMNFLGAVGGVMDGSGIDEAFQVNYGGEYCGTHAEWKGSIEGCPMSLSC